MWANLRADGASDTLTGAAFQRDLSSEDASAGSKNWPAQCRMGGKYTCGPWFQSTGLERTSEYVVRPQFSGYCPDTTAAGSGGSASGPRCSCTTGSLVPEGSRTADAGYRFAIDRCYFQHINRCAEAGALHPASTQPDQRSSAHAAGDHDAGGHRLENHREHDIR